jgi:hypothetical protein
LVSPKGGAAGWADPDGRRLKANKQNTSQDRVLNHFEFIGFVSTYLVCANPGWS